MSYIKNKKLFYINSRNRENGTDNDFEVTVQLPSFQNFSKICVLSITLPKSYYCVQDGYNTFILKENTTQTTITLPPANYNRRSLASTITTLLNLVSPNGWIYEITYPNHLLNADNGKYTITVSGNSTQPSFIFDDNGVYELLGFSANSTNTFINDKIISTNVCKIQSEDVIRLHSNMSDNNGDDVLLEIYSGSTQTFSNIVWTCPDVQAYSREITRRSTNSYRFFLTNEDNQRINFNGLNVCFTILVYEPITSLLKL